MYKLSMSNFLRICHNKSHSNRLILDKVIGKIKGGRFFGTVYIRGTKQAAATPSSALKTTSTRDSSKCSSKCSVSDATFGKIVIAYVYHSDKYTHTLKYLTTYSAELLPWTHRHTTDDFTNVHLTPSLNCNIINTSWQCRPVPHSLAKRHSSAWRTDLGYNGVNTWHPYIYVSLLAMQFLPHTTMSRHSLYNWIDPQNTT